MERRNINVKRKITKRFKRIYERKRFNKKNTVQLIRSSILQIEKDKAIEVTDEQIIEIIAKEAKKRKDAAQDFEKSGREDLINQNNKELEILTSYLPKQLDIEEIENIVKDIIKESGATSMKDMGIVMKTAKEKIGASADGKTISDVVKKLLS